MTDATERVDTWEMVVVHRVFRREVRQAADLIRGVRDGDRDRAEVVGTHLAAVLAGLHHHHLAEDELLWPVLLQRAHLHADLVRRMEAQHHRLADLMERAEPLLARWRTTGDAATGGELADVVEQASAVLDEHLGEEEREILPLVSEHLSPAEWSALGERGQEAMPKDLTAFVFLGMILQDATPTERTMFLGHLPAPVRWGWRTVGRRIHRRAMARVYGTG